MGGLLMNENKQDLSILGGMRSQDDATKARIRKVLERDWGIQSREDALDMIDWLMREGHRKEVVELCAAADQGASKGMLGDEDLDRKLGFLEQHRTRLLRAGLLAWDANRLVVLAGWASFVGLISEVEAWSPILGMAFAVQQSYGSWEEYGSHHLLGFEYWKGEWNGGFARNYRRLLDDPSSPWRTLPWTTDLRHHGLQVALPTPGYHVPPAAQPRPQRSMPMRPVDAQIAHAQAMAAQSVSKSWMVSLLMVLVSGAFVAYMLWHNGVF